jgi:hypothetical protein
MASSPETAPVKSYMIVVAIAHRDGADNADSDCDAKTEIGAFITLPIGLRCFNQ